MQSLLTIELARTLAQDKSQEGLIERPGVSWPTSNGRAARAARACDRRAQARRSAGPRESPPARGGLVEGHHFTADRLDTARILDLAASGDPHAWQLLIQRHGATVRAVARRHRLGTADQEDIVQQTWLRLWTHIARLREPNALEAWLATVARRECLRLLGASQHELPMAETPDADTAGASELADAVAARDRRDAVHAAIHTLPDHQQRLIRTLLANPHATYDQLSAALGTPRGSIGPTRRRALARLRHHPALTRVVDRPTC